MLEQGMALVHSAAAALAVFFSDVIKAAGKTAAQFWKECHARRDEFAQPRFLTPAALIAKYVMIGASVVAVLSGICYFLGRKR